MNKLTTLVNLIVVISLPLASLAQIPAGTSALLLQASSPGMPKALVAPTLVNDRTALLELRNDLYRQKSQLMEVQSILRKQQLDRNGWTTLNVAARLVTVVAALSAVHLAYSANELALPARVSLDSAQSHNNRIISIVVSTAVIAASAIAIGDGKNDVFHEMKIRSVDIKRLSAKVGEKLANIQKAEELLRNLERNPT